MAVRTPSRSSSAPAPAPPKNYVTPGGYARLKRELTQLLDVERPELVKVISWAASNGDRSENGDYIYGKKRLREIDRRVRFLRPQDTRRIASFGLFRGKKSLIDRRLSTP